MPPDKRFELRLGEYVKCEPHGQALLLGAVDGSGSTFIVVVVKNGRPFYTLITTESIIEKYEPEAQLVRIRQASFGTDLLATGTGGAGH